MFPREMDVIQVGKDKPQVVLVQLTCSSNSNVSSGCSDFGILSGLQKFIKGTTGGTCCSGTTSNSYLWKLHKRRRGKGSKQHLLTQRVVYQAGGGLGP